MEGLSLMGKGSRKTSWRRKDLSLALSDGWEFNRKLWGEEVRKGLCGLRVAGLCYREALVFLWAILNCHVKETCHIENTQINWKLV